MASKTSGSRKLKKKSLPKFEADVYSKIPSDGLIVFAVHYLIEQKIDITLEDIVSLCFLLFPRRFGLKRYPKWPDSTPISRHWGDVRRKRYVTVNDYLGYRLTTKGIRLVKKVARVLGVMLPKPKAKVRPTQPKKAVVIPVEKKQSAISEKKSVKPVKKVRKEKGRAEIQKKIALLFQEEKTTPPAPVKKVPLVPAKKVTPTPVEVKQVQKPEIKSQAVQEKKVTTPVPVKKAHPTRAKKAPSKLKKKAQDQPISKPIQPLTPAHPKKRRGGSVSKAPSKDKETKPAKPVIVQPVKVEKIQAEPLSREAKERAGKFTRMMERSDAYIHYKKNGSSSRISEFDFRSLLLCTMESSAETLARNVDLFKGYAEIHHRQDLIVFLTFCEDKFSHLLKPARKAKK